MSDLPHDRFGNCPRCRGPANGYIRALSGIWAICQHCYQRWPTNYRLPYWTDADPEPAPFQKDWPVEKAWAFREEMLTGYAVGKANEAAE
jgi:hypothetical protein